LWKSSRIPRDVAQNNAIGPVVSASSIYDQDTDNEDAYDREVVAITCRVGCIDFALVTSIVNFVKLPPPVGCCII
jgi:hypothetical protein